MEARKAIASMPPGHCLGALEIYNFHIGTPLPKRKCPGALALSKTKHTGNVHIINSSKIIGAYM